MAKQSVKQITPEARAVGTHYKVGADRSHDVSERSPAADPAGRDDQQIARVAYEIWVSRGRPEGSDREDWFEAERRLGASKGEKTP